MKPRDTKFYLALKRHYEAQKDEALATLDLYFTNSVGIGEHSNILNEFKEWTHKLCEADEALEVLEKYFEND
tara:strand:+ start:380 stop:595 length:216 start_codon:yes stop_codon:yes gene_type:complete